TVAVPPVCCSRPRKILIAVLLPAPLSPRIPGMPSSLWNETSLRATTVLYRFVRPRAVGGGVAGVIAYRRDVFPASSRCPAAVAPRCPASATAASPAFWPGTHTPPRIRVRTPASSDLSPAPAGGMRPLPCSPCHRACSRLRRIFLHTHGGTSA